MLRKMVSIRRCLTSQCGSAQWFSASSATGASPRDTLASQTRESSTRLCRSQSLGCSLSQLLMEDAIKQSRWACSQWRWRSWALTILVSSMAQPARFAYLTFKLSTPGMKVNALDLSPNFAGTLMGITNGIGALTGIAAVSRKLSCDNNETNIDCPNSLT